MIGATDVGLAETNEVIQLRRPHCSLQANFCIQNLRILSGNVPCLNPIGVTDVRLAKTNEFPLSMGSGM
jgi:hypothetical protein